MGQMAVDGRNLAELGEEGGHRSSRAPCKGGSELGGDGIAEEHGKRVLFAGGTHPPPARPIAQDIAKGGREVLRRGRGGKCDEAAAGSVTHRCRPVIQAQEDEDDAGSAGNACGQGVERLFADVAIGVAEVKPCAPYWCGIRLLWVKEVFASNLFKVQKGADKFVHIRIGQR